MKHFSYKGGCGMHVGVHIKHLKEDLTWAKD